MNRVVVVGGGIAGLAAAWELTGGAGGPEPGGPAVVLLERHDHLGGKIRTATFAGRPVDRAADGFLGRRPEATDLCRELGLGDELEPIGATGAAVWVGRRRRPLPKDLALGVPTRFLPTARSQILGAEGTLALLRDVVAPKGDRRGPLGDRAVGPLVAHKLGPRVVERLVEPLLGGIYAGGVTDMSAAAVFPALLEAAGRRGSFMRALRGAVAAGARDRTEAPEPAFWSLRRGIGSLTERLAESLARRGVELRSGSGADALEPGGEGTASWRVRVGAETIGADGVILAVPAFAAADLLEPLEPETALLLRGVEYSSVAVVTTAWRADQLPERLVGTGLLVPRGSPGPDGLHGDLMVTACTYLSNKWPHLARAGEVLIRASVGRLGDDRVAGLDDDELAERVQAELGYLLGTSGRARAVGVDRWPAALPQYRVHHGMRTAGVEAALQRLGGLAVAGAAFHGVGIPACVGSGRRVARLLLDGPPPGAPTGADDETSATERTG